jgi:hypothetical protein
MKTKIVLVVLGCVSAMVAAGVRADDRRPDGSTRPSSLSDPVQPGRAMTEREARQELDEARLALTTALQHYGNISPQARLAIDRVNKAQADYDVARQATESAAVQGGAGSSGGDVVTGPSH